MRYIPVAGTWGIKQPLDWFSPFSNFTKFMARNGHLPLISDPSKQFMWDTELDGITEDYVWDAAGRSLASFVMPPLLGKTLVAPEDTYIIAHSHGGNVVAFACAKYGLKINGLVTVGTPIRKDLYPVYEAAAENINHHLHLYAGWRDYWQILGSLGLLMNNFGIHRKHPFATLNAKVPGGDHGSILRDSSFFHYWLDNNWLNFWVGH